MATVIAMLHRVALLVGVVHLYCVYMHVSMRRPTYKQCSCAACSDHKISWTIVNKLDTRFKNLYNLWLIGSHMSCVCIPVQQVITQFPLHA